MKKFTARRKPVRTTHNAQRSGLPRCHWHSSDRRACKYNHPLADQLSEAHCDAPAGWISLHKDIYSLSPCISSFEQADLISKDVICYVSVANAAYELNMFQLTELQLWT